LEPAPLKGIKGIRKEKSNKSFVDTSLRYWEEKRRPQGGVVLFPFLWGEKVGGDVGLEGKIVRRGRGGGLFGLEGKRVRRNLREKTPTA